MLSLIIVFSRTLPDRQGINPAIPIDFSGAAPGKLCHDLVWGLSPIGPHKHSFNQRLALSG